MLYKISHIHCTWQRDRTAGCHIVKCWDKGNNLVTCMMKDEVKGEGRGSMVLQMVTTSVLGATAQKAMT
jgi:hypothetical protein